MQSIMPGMVYNRTAEIVRRAKIGDDHDYYCTADGNQYCAGDGTPLMVSADLSGAWLNACDLNRIEMATAHLREVLAGYGYNIALTTKTDWRITDWPTVSQLGRIRDNINALRDGFYSLPDWREIARRYLPSGEETADYDILNAEEWDLYILGVWVDRITQVFAYSGEVFAGEYF